MSTTQQAAKITVQIMPGMVPLTMLLVILKAFGKLDWSWWYVFAPLWGPWALVVGFSAGVLAVVAVITAALFLYEVPFDTYKKWKWGRAKCAACGGRRDAKIHQSSYHNSNRHYFLGRK